MADYGIFRTNDAKRIAAATKVVEGSGRAFLRVPERVARSAGSPALTRDIINSYGGPWTIAEYDPDTGSILRTFDRGRRRQTNALSSDVAILLSADEAYLFAGGRLDINANDGELTKWNIGNYSREWNSDKGAHNPTVFADVASGFASVRPYGPLLEASDGFIWTCVGKSADDYIARINPDTGAQTHEYTWAVGALQLMRADSNGGVVACSLSADGGEYMRVLDNTATETASYTTAILDAYESGGKIMVVNSASAVAHLSAADLTTTASRGAASDASSYEACCHDGTYAYVKSTTKYFKYDLATLATEVWATAHGTHTNSHAMIYNSDNNYIYDCAYTTVSTTVGGVYKVDPATGSIVWSYTAQGSVLLRTAIGFGSDFVVFIGFTNGGYNIYCLNDSDGSLRWNDFWTQPYGVQVSSDDRIFICGPRYGP